MAELNINSYFRNLCGSKGFSDNNDAENSGNKYKVAEYKGQ